MHYVFVDCDEAMIEGDVVKDFLGDLTVKNLIIRARIGNRMMELKPVRIVDHGYACDKLISEYEKHQDGDDFSESFRGEDK
jgi:hypothetical protein